MKMYKTFFTIALTALFSITSFAQTTETVKEKAKTEAKTEVKTQNATKPQTTTPAVKKVVKVPKKAYLDGGTIKEQYDYLIKMSNRYEDKKIIKIKSLNRFEANVKDSLNLVKKNLSDTKVLTRTQKTEIDSLKKELEAIKLKLEETVNSKDSMSLLGIQIPKSTYNTIMWVIILVSLLIAAICFFLFKRSHVVTVETKETLEDVREEFDTHRKNALVREQKLARKLQDEVIKNKNLGL